MNTPHPIDQKLYYEWIRFHRGLWSFLVNNPESDKFEYTRWTEIDIHYNATAGCVGCHIRDLINTWLYKNNLSYYSNKANLTEEGVYTEILCEDYCPIIWENKEDLCHGTTSIWLNWSDAKRNLKPYKVTEYQQGIEEALQERIKAATYLRDVRFRPYDQLLIKKT